MRHVHRQLILALALAAAAHAQTKAAIVYSAATSRVRRVIIPDKDAELGSVTVGKGEAVILVDRASMSVLAKAQSIVTAKTGVVPTNDRYVVVPSGKGVQPVTAVVIADPDCGDIVPGADLIQHDTADVTWQYDRDKGAFVAPAPADPGVVTPKEKQ